MGFELGFGMFGVLFAIVFVLVLSIIIVTMVKGIGQWNRNNHSPRLTVDATVVTKRIDVTHHHQANANGMGGFDTSSTSYYVTFQVNSGDRMELQVTGNEYGLLVEGDRGILNFQGTRYLGFDPR